MSLTEINPNVFLLGAGFSKNFGGFLGIEIRDRLFNRPILSSHSRIKALFWAPGFENMTYEDIYSEVMENSSFGQPEKDAMEQALKEVMDDQEREFDKYGPKRVYALKKLIGLLEKLNKQTFVFTLNHDLHFEKQWRVDYALHVPGLFLNGAPHCIDIPRYSRNILPTVVLPDQARIDQRGLGMHKDGGLYYVKLHGSMNFLSVSDPNQRRIVMGRRKVKQLRKEPLLAAYLDIFEQVILRPNINLFICGYSFGDQHINDILIAARKECGLKVSVLDPAPRYIIGETALRRAGVSLRTVIDYHFPYRILDDLFPDGEASNTGAWAQVRSLYRPDLN